MKIKKIPKGFIICDGMAENADYFTIILYVLILCGGLIGFGIILYYWTQIKDKIKSLKRG